MIVGQRIFRPKTGAQVAVDLYQSAFVLDVTIIFWP
jgi:hypothetical protein